MKERVIVANAAFVISAKIRVIRDRFEFINFVSLHRSAVLCVGEQNTGFVVLGETGDFAW